MRIAAELVHERPAGVAVKGRYEGGAFVPMWVYINGMRYRLGAFDRHNQTFELLEPSEADPPKSNWWLVDVEEGPSRITGYGEVRHG